MEMFKNEDIVTTMSISGIRSTVAKDSIGYLTTKTIPNAFDIEQFTVTAGMRHFINGKETTPIFEEQTLALQGVFSYDPNTKRTCGRG